MLGRPRSRAVAGVECLLRLHSLETRSDRVGGLLGRHEPGVDELSFDRRIQLHHGTSCVGDAAQLPIDESDHARDLLLDVFHVREERRDRNAEWTRNGSLAHSAGQVLFPPVCIEVPEPLRCVDLSDDFRHGDVVVVGDRALCLLDDFEPREVAMEVADEVVGVVPAAGSVVQAQLALLFDRLCGRARQQRFALRGSQLAGKVARKLRLIFRVDPPRANDRRSDPHAVLLR